MARKGSAAAKSAAKSSSGVSTAAIERRVDPADGQVLTFDELRVKYANMYSKVQIKSYWSDDCQSVSVASTPRAMARQASSKQTFNCSSSKQASPPASESEQDKKALDSGLSGKAEQEEVKPSSLQPQDVQQGVEAEPSVPLLEASAGEMEGASIEVAPKEATIPTAAQLLKKHLQPIHEKAIPAAPQSVTVEDAKLSLPQPESSGTRNEQPALPQEQAPDPSVGPLAAAELASGELVEHGASTSEDTGVVAPEPVLQEGIQQSTLQREDEAPQLALKEAAGACTSEAMVAAAPEPAFQEDAEPSTPLREDKAPELALKETSGAATSEATAAAAPEPACQEGIQPSTPQREDKAPELALKEAKPEELRVSTVASPQRCGDSPSKTPPRGDSPSKTPPRTLPATTSLVTVTFSVPYHTSLGEDIVIVGNTEALGEWDPAKAAAMRWTDGHIWVATIELELPPAASGELLEYKYVLMCHGQVKMWEDCENRSLCQVHSGSSLVCNNIWGDLSSAVIRN